MRVCIRDVRTRAAIPGVELLAPSGDVLGRSDSDGVIRVRVSDLLPFGGQLRRVGYVPSSVTVTGHEPGDSVVVLLAPASAQTLGAVEVRTEAAVARFAGFDQRRSSGGPGIFLTDSQVMKTGYVRLIDVFRRMPSLYVLDSAGVPLVASRRAPKPVYIGGKLDLAPCIFQVVVDDVRMPWGFDVNLLNAREIHGIEIYSGPATIPPQYRGTSRDAMCGLIAIWTKSR